MNLITKWGYSHFNELLAFSVDFQRLAPHFEKDRSDYMCKNQVEISFTILRFWVNLKINLGGMTKIK